MTDWHYATLVEAADAIRTRKISPVELTRALLNRIARLEPSLHSYATVTSELALVQAVQAETEIADGLSGFLRFATPFDMSGSPTITLPGGFTSKGLPLSFQLVGRHLDEALLVRAGHAYQQITDWHRKHPLP